MALQHAGARIGRLHWEDPLKNWLALSLLAIATPALAQQAAPPPAAAPSLPVVMQNPPVIPFDSAPDFLKLPTNMYLGEASAVTVNSKGHVFVFSRGGSSVGPAFAETAAQLLEFAPDGKFVREVGKNLYAWSFAHGIKADRHDNIWAVDKGSNMVVKFRPSGLVDMVFGRKMEASDDGTGPLRHPDPPLPAADNQFRQPTDAAF